MFVPLLALVLATGAEAPVARSPEQLCAAAQCFEKAGFRGLEIKQLQALWMTYPQQAVAAWRALSGMLRSDATVATRLLSLSDAETFLMDGEIDEENAALAVGDAPWRHADSREMVSAFARERHRSPRVAAAILSFALERLDVGAADAIDRKLAVPVVAPSALAVCD